MRSLVTLAVVGATALTLATGCSSDGSAIEPSRTILELPGSEPGEVIALRAGAGEATVEWIDRRSGTIRAVTIPEQGPATDGDITTLATIAVSSEGEQRGLLGHTVINDIRYASWTDPDTNHLLVGEVGEVGEVEGEGAEGGAAGGTRRASRIVWDGGGTAGGAVGGHLEASADGLLILGIGQLTDWAKAHGSGAMVQLDPVGPADQVPVVLSDGYTNPFAFTVVDGRLWVADNAVGDDVERIGRGDLEARGLHAATGQSPRAPSAVIALADGTLAVCGFLDGQLLAWGAGDVPGYSRTLGPCLTGAVSLADGTVVTASTSADGGSSLLLLRSP